MSSFRSVLLKYKCNSLHILNYEVTASVPSGKLILYQPLRQYRNIYHKPLPTPMYSKLFFTFIFMGFIVCIFDIKTIFGLRDFDKEMDELINYTIPDEFANFTEKPGLRDKKP